MNELAVTLKITISDDEINDIVSTIVETQAISYWCAGIKVDPQKYDVYPYQALTSGKSLIFKVSETDDDSEIKEYRMSKADFLKGLRRYVEEYPECITNEGIDGTKIDGTAVDIIAQYALFDEIVFG